MKNPPKPESEGLSESQERQCAAHPQQTQGQQVRSPGINPIVVVVIAVALVVFAVVGVMALSIVRNLANRNSAESSGTSDASTVELPLAVLQPWQGTERLNVLLLGIDQRPNESANTTRTDTMIVLTLDPASRTAGMMSIPRDLYVVIPGFEQNRINTAHVFGGPSLAMQTVSDNFGIPIQHYVRVNFEVVVTLVDHVGGIDIMVDEDINDPLYPDMNYGYDPFVISAGKHHMDGATALKYARTRHGASDFFRMRRQQQVIMALRDRVLTTDAVMRLLPQIGQVWGSLQRSINTDLSVTELVQLLLFAKDLPSEHISKVVIDEKAAVRYITPQGADVLIPVQDRIKSLRAELYNPPVPTPVPTATSAPVKLAIQNGTQTKGLAAAVQTRMKDKGYMVVSIGDAPGKYAQSAIIDYRGQPEIAQRLAEALSLPLSDISTSLDAGSEVDVLIIIGADYSNK